MTKKEKIVYYHIPKCGGTSFYEALQREFKNPFRLSSIHSDEINSFLKIEDSITVRTILQARLMQEKKDCVYGHFFFNKDLHLRFKKEYAFCILFREPISRFISQFFYNFYRKHDDFYIINQSLVDFIQTKKALKMANTSLRMLTSSEEVNEKILKKAKENLSYFDYVGVIEYKKDFVTSLNNDFDFKLKLDKVNQTTANMKELNKFITPEIINKIKELSFYEQQLYDHVLNNFILNK